MQGGGGGAPGWISEDERTEVALNFRAQSLARIEGSKSAWKYLAMLWFSMTSKSRPPPVS